MEKVVFIVDDNDCNLTVVAAMLESEYTVLTMASARKMFSLLEKKRPNIILIDMEMPEMNGFEAIAKLNEHPEWNDIPVLMLTGWCDESVKARALELGVCDIIVKPCKLTLLLDAVEKFAK